MVRSVRMALLALRGLGSPDINGREARRPAMVALTM